MKRHDDDVVSAVARVEDARLPSSEHSTGLMQRVKRALFEAELKSDRAARVEPATRAPSELEAAIASTLREAVSRGTGPALAEFNLQIEAVRGIVPDPETQIKIALSVLAKKSISRRELEQDLAAVSTLLAQQLNSFTEKLAARRREHALSVEQVESHCRDVRAQAEAEISALEAALVAQREALARASAERESRLGELSAAERAFEEKELAFRGAQGRLLAEYERLTRDLEKSFGEKV